MAKLNIRELERFAEKVNKLAQSERNEFAEDCIKELAARMLRKVKMRTPVGQYGKKKPTPSQRARAKVRPANDG